MRGWSSSVQKVYRLVVFTGGEITQCQLDSLREPLEPGSLPAQIDIARRWSEMVAGSHSDYAGEFAEVLVTLLEGRHRQIRRLCTRAKLRESSLTRRSYGPITLSEDLPVGSARPLSCEEVSNLIASCYSK